LRAIEYRFFSKTNENIKTVLLPWKSEIKVHCNDDIGHSILMTGIYDLIVTEILWRLINKGEIAVDVGANIGYMTSLMAAKVTSSGKVYSYEAHPEIFQELSENLNIWNEQLNWQHIQIQHCAISDQVGELQLIIPDQFKTNRGLSKIGTSKNCDHSYSVPSSKLDILLNYESDIEIGVLKIDIEGHELEAFNGAKELISAHKIRDIIFEDYDHESYPNNLTNFLEGYGYTIFKAVSIFWQPIVCSPTSQQVSRSWEPTCYIATIDPERVKNCVKKIGWFSIHNIET
jgi:FkbM family methyltransferase